MSKIAGTDTDAPAAGTQWADSKDGRSNGQMRRHSWKARGLGVCRIYREAVLGVRLRVRTNHGVKVLIGQKHWSVRSRRQRRRREAGWGAAGSERPVHKQNNDELDSA